MSSDLPLSVHTERHGDAVVIAVSGELDLAVAGRLRDVLTAPEARAGIVVLDLRSLSFTDSAGLGVIIGQHRRAMEGGFDFFIVNGPPPIARIFRLTGLDRILRFVDDPANATVAPPS